MQTPETKVPEKAIDRLKAKYGAALLIYKDDCRNIAEANFREILKKADEAAGEMTPYIVFILKITGNRERAIDVWRILSEMLHGEGFMVNDDSFQTTTVSDSITESKKLRISGWVETKKEKESENKDVAGIQESKSSFINA